LCCSCPPSLPPLSSVLFFSVILYFVHSFIRLSHFSPSSIPIFLAFIFVFFYIFYCIPFFCLLCLSFYLYSTIIIFFYFLHFPSQFLSFLVIIMIIDTSCFSVSIRVSYRPSAYVIMRR
jgi:hypothetical protein